MVEFAYTNFGVCGYREGGWCGDGCDRHGLFSFDVD